MEKAEREEKRRKGIIQIPSYQEVFDTASIDSGGGNNPKPCNPPPPPASFSQAFFFVKSSEFYTPPPQNPTPPPPRPLAQPQPSPSSSATSTANSNSISNNVTLQSRNAILVSHRQKGNPLLKHIRDVRSMFADIVCNYLLGQSSCALYL